MFVVDIHTLQAVNLLNLVDEVLLQFLLTQNSEDVVRVARTIHQRFTGPDALARLYVDMHASRQGILTLFLVVGYDIDFALALDDLTVADHAVDLRHDGRFLGAPRFEEFDNTRQTTGDVLRLGGFTRNLGDHIAAVNVFPVSNHQVSIGRDQILALCLAFAVPNLNLWLAFFVRRVGNNPL